MLRLVVLLLCATAPTAFGEPALPTWNLPVVSLRAGVFCDASTGEREPAPHTELGYIERAPDQINIGPPRQTLPAEIGLSFGVEVVSIHDVAPLTIRISRPGRAKPDEWADGLVGLDKAYVYFAFAFPFEQVPGLYVIEGFDANALLFRAEFEVRPPESMPALAAECRDPMISRDTFSRRHVL